MRLVVVESPYAGDVERNLSYLRACLADCLRRNEAPIASHALYTQPGVLDDTKPEERKKGMLAGWAWHRVADTIVVYTDLGVTPGMRDGRDHARELGKLIEVRELGGEWQP